MVVGILTFLQLAIYLFLPLVYKIDPKKKAAENKGRLQKLAFALPFLFLLYPLSCGR